MISLWLLAAIATVVWVWLSNMDAHCAYTADNPGCLGQIFGHGLAPMVGWIALFLAALALIGSLIALGRRLFR